MARYFVLSNWHVSAPGERVWDTLTDFQAWPEWWPDFEKVVELEPGDPEGRGALHRLIWNQGFPSLSFNYRTTHVLPGRILEGEVRGELEGTGRWEFKDDGHGTLVHCTWSIRTNRWAVNLFSPILGRLLHRRHRRTMISGEKHLQHRLSN